MSITKTFIKNNVRVAEIEQILVKSGLSQGTPYHQFCLS